MKAAINCIIYQLRICRQKTINFSPFEVHFGRKANSPPSNISTDPDPNTLKNNIILNKHLDMEAVHWDELISDEQWDKEPRGDIEFEKRDQLSKDARKCCNEDPDKKSCMIPYPNVGLLEPRTEASLTLELVKKKSKSKRSKKNLDRLYEVLSAGSSLMKSNEQTSTIKEPGGRKVTIRNSDLAKFGTKTERQTDLKCYARHRPKEPTGKTTEELISRHAKDAKRKTEGGKKINYRRTTDYMNCVSSINSNVSRALRLRMPTEPKNTVVPIPLQPTLEKFTDLAPPKTLPQTSIIIAEPPTRPIMKAATKSTTAIQRSNERKRSSPSKTESDESMASTQTCPPTYKQKQPLYNRKDEMLKQQQIESKYIVSTVKNTAARNQDAEQSNFTVGQCSPIQTYPTQFYVSPIYEGTENIMTVREAECASDMSQIEHKTT